MKEKYTKVNAEVIDKWATSGWEWGVPIDHETFVRAKSGNWSVLLTPTKPVPFEWFCELRNASVLGLASGGGQQIPVFAAQGAVCTVLDYSEKQLESETLVAEREGYSVIIIRADMTKTLPFENESFDLIFHPVSNCYIEDVQHVWNECHRILKPNGILLSGLDNGMNYVFDDDEKTIARKLPFNPLENQKLLEESMAKDWGIQFSHTIEEQIGGQLSAGFQLTDLYQDTNGLGNLHEHNIPSFFATRSVKTQEEVFSLRDR
jgi:SAM-dependent methyltransferase